MSNERQERRARKKARRIEKAAAMQQPVESGAPEIPYSAYAQTLKREQRAMFLAMGGDLVARIPRHVQLPDWMYDTKVLELLNGYGHDVAGIGVVYFGLRNTLDRLNPNWLVSKLWRSELGVGATFLTACGFELMQKSMGDKFEHLSHILPTRYDENDYYAYILGLGLTYGLKRWVDRPISAAIRMRKASGN